MQGCDYKLMWLSGDKTIGAPSLTSSSLVMTILGQLLLSGVWVSPFHVESAHSPPADTPSMRGRALPSAVALSLRDPYGRLCRSAPFTPTVITKPGLLTRLLTRLGRLLSYHFQSHLARIDRRPIAH